MSRVRVAIDDRLVDVLEALDQPLEQLIHELVVLELYRQARISNGKAAQLLGLSRIEFIRRAGQLGIPYFRMSAGEWEAEMRQVDAL